jgi:hypothetical protein
MTEERPTRGATILPFRRPAPEATDVTINARWNHFLRLATNAWEWRDPESVDALDRCLAELRATIVREWSA